MKLVVTMAALTMAFAVSARADLDPKAFEITSMKVQEASKEEAAAYASVGVGSVDCSVSNGQNRPFATTLEDQNPLDPIKQIDMIVDQIINIGKKIWNIVDAGKPVSNIQTDVATAMPLGARCWNDLEGWQVPQSKVYKVAFANVYGAEVVKMAYRVLWLPGGSAKGVGQYIGYATITPVDVNVSWGFALNAKVAIPTVFNMGSAEAPIAGMQMDMAYEITSPFNNIKQSQAFFVDGRGQFQLLQ